MAWLTGMLDPLWMVTNPSTNRKAQIPLGSSRHASTRHVRRVEPIHFACLELVEQHGSTRSSRRARYIERDVSCRVVT